MIKKIFTYPIVKYVLFGLLVASAMYLLLSGDRNKALSVKKINLENRIVEKTVSASGIVESDNDINLSFGYTGEIQDIYVKKGDKVYKGDLLAKLDSASLRSSVQAAKDARDVAIRDLELYIQKYESHKDQVGGTDEYNISVRRLEELKSSAQATYESQTATINNTLIYAPFNGTVYDILKSEGENATLNETILKLADLDNILYTVELDQEDFGQIKLDQSVEVVLDSYPDKTVMGTVVELPKFANGSSSPRFKVKIKLTPNAEITPLIGMTGDAHIVTAVTQNEVPSLYYDEVYTDENDKEYVWIIDNDLIAKKYVEIGLEGDIYYEITTNIDKQIIAPLNDDVTLKEGYKPKVVK